MKKLSMCFAALMSASAASAAVTRVSFTAPSAAAPAARLSPSGFAGASIAPGAASALKTAAESAAAQESLESFRRFEREMDREDEEDRAHARAQAERDLQELLEKRGIAPLMGRLELPSELPAWAKDANYGIDEDYHRALVVWTESQAYRIEQFERGRASVVEVELPAEARAGKTGPQTVLAAREFAALRFSRERVAGAVRKYMEQAGLPYTLREEKGRFLSAFRLNFRAPLAGHGKHLSALDGIVGH